MQWERYRGRLPNDAPSTFGGFRRIKNAGGKAWEELQALYRDAGKAIKGEATSGPHGTPVSEALTVNMPRDSSASLAAEMERTLGIIDSVHGDGTLTPIKIERLFGEAEERGAFWIEGKEGSSPSRIEVNPNGNHTSLTLAHEIGHFLDYDGIGNKEFATSYANRLDPPIRDAVVAWHDAIMKSDAMHQLEALADSRGGITYFTNEDGLQLATPVPVDYINRYLMSNSELFARSYAQYIAETSGDSAMMEQLGRELGMQPGDRFYLARQWTQEDFAPIKAAFDRLFEALGWRT